MEPVAELQPDQIISTNDLIDKKQDPEQSVLVEEVSVVEDEVKISAVIDSAEAAVEETPSSIAETTSELQPLENATVDELSNLIDFDASKDDVGADETNEEEAVPPITSVATTTVDVGETSETIVVANAETTLITETETETTVTSTVVEQEQEEKVDEKKEKEKKKKKEEQAVAQEEQQPQAIEASIVDEKEHEDQAQSNSDQNGQEKEIQEDKLNDDMQVEDANVQQQEDADNEPAPAAATTEDMDIDTFKTLKKKQSGRKGNSRPSKAKGKAAAKAPIIDDGDFEDEEMPEFEVENIAGHRVFKGKVVKYIVKWKGYPSSENTVENAVTMHDDVPELCAAYWATCKEKRPDNVPHVDTEELEPIIEQQQQNNDDTDEAYEPATVKSPSATKSSSDDEEEEEAPVAPPTKRKRNSSAGAADSPSFKKFKKNMEHIPDYMVKLGYQFPVHWPNKKTEWDVDVKKVCVQASPIDNKVRFTYLEWNNGEKTIHNMKEAHEMIPEKLIHYYEERLQFI